jgi:predicted RNA-binding Zn-ribbon protein involved in translation (DUF1610 family)
LAQPSPRERSGAGAAPYPEGDSVSKFDCPACGRWIGSNPRTGRLAHHRYTGETPSVWLRAGERCPTGGAFINALYGAVVLDGEFPFQPCGYSESDPEAHRLWLDELSPNPDGWDPLPRNRYTVYLRVRGIPWAPVTSA